MSKIFNIEKGDVWAGNFWSRHWHGVSGLTIGKNFRWSLSLDMTDCPTGTTIKLCGIATASPFRWNRIETGGWSEFPNFTHEDSDRVIATKTSDTRITLRTYAYRNGYGPATETSRSFQLRKIGETAECQQFAVFINEKGGQTRYTLKDHLGNRHHAQVPRKRKMGFLKHKTFAHAKGYEQPSAPGDIHITVF